eukprot:TRINITY_DN1909_c2_g1_i1.p1 TRINITY_DN1909_c2_g1~~TRINITY_DN1909_c2_g1_i1.p1  ORF type:complete len:386 (+),score=46.24 TRINITY_DN1909_c2_g1_i1:48-1205(+)
MGKSRNPQAARRGNGTGAWKIKGVPLEDWVKAKVVLRNFVELLDTHLLGDDGMNMFVRGDEASVYRTVCRLSQSHSPHAALDYEFVRFHTPEDRSTSRVVQLQLFPVAPHQDLVPPEHMKQFITAAIEMEYQQSVGSIYSVTTKPKAGRRPVLTLLVQMKTAGAASAMVGQKNPLFGGVRCGNFVVFSLQQYDRKEVHGKDGLLRGTVSPAVVDKAINEARCRVPGTCERSRLARLEWLASKLCSPQDHLSTSSCSTPRVSAASDSGDSESFKSACDTPATTHTSDHSEAMMYNSAPDSQPMTCDTHYPQSTMSNSSCDTLVTTHNSDHSEATMYNSACDSLGYTHSPYHYEPMMCDRSHDSEATMHNYGDTSTSYIGMYLRGLA